MRKQKKKILVGNTFSLTLVRGREVEIMPVSIVDLKDNLSTGEVVSFWGHENTRSRAEEVAGISLLPKVIRPAISLSRDNLPMLDGEIFTECYVLSPDYVPGFRPSPTDEVSNENIIGWHALKLIWK